LLVADSPEEDWLFGDGGFAKIYGDRLAESSLLQTAVSTRWVFIWMLSQADYKGRFKCCDIPTLAHASRTRLTECRRAVHTLEQPDASSQTPDHEGRRIKKIHGGWQVLNYEKYRDFRTHRQVNDAERQQAHRERKRDMSRDVTVTPRDIATRHQTPDTRDQRQTAHRDPEPLLPSEQVVEVDGENASTPGKSKRKKPKYELQWEPGADGNMGTFVGDRDALRAKVNGLYLEEFGQDWIRRTWQTCLDWCNGEGKEKIKAKKDCWLFALGWFRRDAAKQREREDGR
jgi:hypothetical protein